MLVPQKVIQIHGHLTWYTLVLSYTTPCKASSLTEHWPSLLKAQGRHHLNQVLSLGMWHIPLMLGHNVVEPMGPGTMAGVGVALLTILFRDPTYCFPIPQLSIVWVQKSCFPDGGHFHHAQSTSFVNIKLWLPLSHLGSLFLETRKQRKESLCCLGLILVRM